MDEGSRHGPEQAGANFLANQQLIREEVNYEESEG